MDYSQKVDDGLKYGCFSTKNANSNQVFEKNGRWEKVESKSYTTTSCLGNSWSTKAKKTGGRFEGNNCVFCCYEDTEYYKEDESACCRKLDVTECTFKGWKYQTDDKGRKLKLSDIGFSSVEVGCHIPSSRSEKPCCCYTCGCHNMPCCTTVCKSCCFWRYHRSCTVMPNEDIPCEVGLCGCMCVSAKPRVAATKP